MPKPVFVKPISSGFEIVESPNNTWIVGETIGRGGFGSLYSASSKKNPKLRDFVLKIEPKENGTLFVESHFYFRVCKQEMLDEWKEARKLSFLGIPRFVARGTFKAPGNQECRFLVMDRFHGSLEDCLNEREFRPADIPGVAIQTLDALEYIHSKGYVHADIKASNLLRADGNKFYLADFGLAMLYLNGGVHNPEKPTPKLRDNGTLEFCSRDAHAGLPPSRRGDLEILLFNLVHWLFRSRSGAPQGTCVGLPWNDFIGGTTVRAKVAPVLRNKVVEAKIEAMEPTKGPSRLLESCGCGRQPALESIIRLVGSLGYTETPDYDRFKDLLRSLAKSLASSSSTTTKTPVGRSSNVLSEIDNKETPSRGTRAQRTSNRKTAKKPSVVGHESPANGRSRLREDVVVEDCGTSHPTDESDFTDADVTPKRPVKGRRGAKPPMPILRPPVRRSARTRRAMNRVFEPSDTEDEDGDEGGCGDTTLEDAEIADKARRLQKWPRARRKPRIGATQTSPNLIRQLEREERRRNFF